MILARRPQLCLLQAPVPSSSASAVSCMLISCKSRNEKHSPGNGSGSSRHCLLQSFSQFLPLQRLQRNSRQSVRKARRVIPFALLCRFFNRLQHGPSCRAAIFCPRFVHGNRLPATCLNFASFPKRSQMPVRVDDRHLRRIFRFCFILQHGKNRQNKPFAHMAGWSSWNSSFSPARNSRDYFRFALFSLSSSQNNGCGQKSPQPVFLPTWALRGLELFQLRRPRKPHEIARNKLPPSGYLFQVGRRGQNRNSGLPHCPFSEPSSTLSSSPVTATPPQGPSHSAFRRTTCTSGPFESRKVRQPQVVFFPVPVIGNKSSLSPARRMRLPFQHSRNRLAVLLPLAAKRSRLAHLFVDEQLLRPEIPTKPPPSAGSCNHRENPFVFWLIQLR